MDKQKAQRTIDAALAALQTAERALEQNRSDAAKAEIWNVRKQLITLSLMLDQERDN